MKYEYIYDDEDVFIDYSWERAFSIYGDVYPEWCLEFFSMMYFDRGVDRTRAGSKERCQKSDMWMMSAMEDSSGINLAWVIPEHLCKHASGLKENSLICGGHYVTKIDHSPSFGRDHYGAHGDSYHTGSIVPSSGYEIEGSSAGFHGDDFDSIVHLEDCVQRNDDEMRD
nr:hypothetical protein [Tanacetum cinerariifolium]